MSKRCKKTGPSEGMSRVSGRGGPSGARSRGNVGRLQLPVTKSGQVNTSQPGIVDWLLQSSSSTSGSTQTQTHQPTEGSSQSSAPTIHWQGEEDVSLAPSPVVSHTQHLLPRPLARGLLASITLPPHSEPLYSEDLAEELPDRQDLEEGIETLEEDSLQRSQESQTGEASGQSLVSSHIATEEESLGEETFIPDYDDDVADPTWNVGQQMPSTESSSGDDDAGFDPPTQRQPPSSARGSRGKRGRRTMSDSLRRQGPGSEPAQQAASEPTPRKRPLTSPVWQFFVVSGGKDNAAICRLCEHKVGRGLGSNPGTTSMRQHMERHHPTAWKNRGQQSTSCCDQQLAAATTLQPVAESQDYAASVASSRSLTPTSASSVIHSSQTPPLMRQQSLSESITRRQQYSSNHPMARTLNAHLAKLIALQSLPFQLVESKPFRDMMACAHPRWRVPSRHFFSNKAIPSLHLYLQKKVGDSLGLSVSNRVHLSADVWSSSYGQGQYMSVTAHWINVFPGELQQQQGAKEVTPLSPPRIERGYHPESSTTSASTITSGPHATAHPVRVAYQNCRAQRCQAVLHLRSLGERSHTGNELLRAMEDDIAKWLTPRHLQVGNVVTDNGRNIVSALQQGGIIHIPCMAHVLNLIVHRFLRSFPGLKDLLKMARKLCTHFSHSYVARNALRKIQRQRGLQEHRLICDVPTRWNSSLHMLDRLYQQRLAVSDFLVTHSGTFSQNCNFQVTDWQMMRDVCRLLAPFEEATLLVSRNEYGVNDIITLLHIMEAALNNIIAEGTRGSATAYDVHLSPEMDQLEEEEEVYGQVFQTPPVTISGLETPEEMEESLLEEDDYSAPWHYTQDTDEEQQSAKLLHMATCLLQCLRSDTRVKDIRRRDDFWLATLVDPRFRRKMPDFFEPSDRVAKVKHYHQLLLSRLVESQEQHYPICPNTQEDVARSTTSTGSTSVRAGSSHSTRFSLQTMLSNFIKPPEEETRQPDTSVNIRQQLNFQVKSYLESPLPLNISDPVQFWAEKLHIWPQLAEFALTILSCPASSVASERVFSAAGAIVTPRRTRLSCLSVERLTFLKMNQVWIGGDFNPPDPPPPPPDV